MLLANFLDSAAEQLLQDFTCADLALSVQLVHQVILSALLFIKDLLGFKVSLSLLFIEFALLHNFFLFLLEITVDLLFVLSHLVLKSLDFRCLLVKLLLNLHEDTLAFLALIFSVADACESSTELSAKLNQTFGDLDLLIELNDLVSVVNNSNNKAITVALKQKLLNVLPRAKELKLTSKSLEVQCRVESFALLEDADGEGALD